MSGIEGGKGRVTMANRGFDIVGFGGHAIPAALTRYGGAGLAVFLPGLRYTNDRPMLYFTQKLLAERGYDALTVNYNYPGIAEFIKASEADQMAWLKADAEVILSSVLDLEANSLVIVGKSIGTALMAHLVPQLPHHDSTRLIWLTPLLKGLSEFVTMPPIRQASFLAIGTADPGYDAEAVARFRADGHMAQVFEGFDHSLDKPGSLSAGMAALSELMVTLDRWLGPQAQSR